VDEGINVCRDLIESDGTGHTAIIYARHDDVIERFTDAMPASRILVNAPASQGLMGADDRPGAVVHTRVRHVGRHLDDEQRDVSGSAEHQARRLSQTGAQRRIPSVICFCGDP
jgi:hypothetical protein